jgi:translation initiation factor 2 alpha subunit (eIF-2alpha)
MEEDETILCTVEKVTNTVTFVRLPDGREGTIISSEIAPGRIKFMRQYVFPNKRIVCKVLKDIGNQVHLSLRRVNAKERNEVMQRFKHEQATSHAIKQLFGEDNERIKEKILKDYKNLTEFIDAARLDEQVMKTYVSADKMGSMLKIIEKKKKIFEIKKSINLKCSEEDGIDRLKKILDFKDEKVEINYIAAGEYVLKLLIEDIKNGKKIIAEIEEELQKRAKENNCEISITDKND